MKIVTNISDKVIGVGGKNLLPDGYDKFDDSVVGNGAVKTLLGMKLLKIEDVYEEKAPEDGPDKTDINNLKKEELVAMCEELGIKVESGDTKAVLVEKINAVKSAQ